ncbi:MAG: Ig-like domain-containing protein [Phycisphaerae bacterium]
MTRNRIARSWMPLVPLALAAMCASAPAVMPATWDQSGESAFARGQFKSTVVNSRGEVMLARDIQVLMNATDAPPVVSSVAVAGKTVYAGSASDNVIFKIEGGKSAKFSEPPGAMVCSLLWTGKELLAGTGGDKAGVYKIDAQGKAVALWTDDKIKYVWAMLEGPKGVLYAATGPAGGVYAIDPAGKAEQIYQVGEKLAKNVQCLALAKDGKLYAGTDTSGLVFEIDPAAKTGRVVLDAEEKEISAIVVGDSGEVYVSTCDASKAEGEGPSTRTSRPSAGPAIRPVPPRTQPGPGPGFGTTTSSSTKSSGPTTGKSAATTEEADEEKEPAESKDTESADTSESSDEGTSDEGESEGAGPSRPGAKGPSGPSAEGGKGPGNSVYRIHKDGLVDTIFHRPVTILAMAAAGNKLVLATGNSGTVYAISTDGQEVAQLARTEAKQVTALSIDKDGAITFATSNKGSVGVIGQALAKEGTFTSKPFDAKQISKWGTIRLSAKAADGAAVTFATRSGNLADADDKTWSAWSKDEPVTDEFIAIASPTARYLQYRLKFTSNGKDTALVNKMGVVYQIGNLEPEITGATVQATSGGEGGGRPSMPRGRGPGPSGSSGQASDGQPKFTRQVEIRASDPNGDQLIYSVFFRQAGATNWIKIADKLTEGQYSWDTRTVGDGEYELKVVASDSPSNPPGSQKEAVKVLTQPVTVDNTPPVIKDLIAKLAGTKVTVNGQATDASRIASIHYSVDSQEEWTAVLPTNGICDSNQVKFDFTTKELKEGSHRIAVKVEDVYGNVGYGAVTATVGK